MFNTLHVPYKGNNQTFIFDLISNYCYPEGLFKDGLLRASEKSELWRVLKYGTDRGGYNNNKKWDLTDIPYEDVIFGTTLMDNIIAETKPLKSSSIKKFTLIKDPVLLIYDIKHFDYQGNNQWEWKNPTKKLDALDTIVFVC